MHPLHYFIVSDDVFYRPPYILISTFQHIVGSINNIIFKKFLYVNNLIE